MKKILALILALVMCFSLVACGGDKDDAKTDKPADASQSTDKKPNEDANAVNTGAADETVNWRKHITFAGGTTAYETCDPMANSSMQNTKQNQLHTERLIYMNPETGALEPMLAEKWEVSADGLVYTFHLREGVTFHNGEPFTADDVLFTAERASDTSISITSACKRNWEAATWEAIDDYTVKATLAAPDADFLIGRTMPYMAVLNREACEADPIEGPWIGTGLWILDEYRGQDGATWVRNDNYWGESTPTERLTLRHIPEPATALIALENGEISFFRGLSALSLDDVKSNEDLDYVQTTSTMCTYLGFNNTKEGPWNDVNFRKALAYAIDYAALAQGSYNGHAEQALTFWGHEAMFGYAPPAEGYTYDVEKAKALLAETDYAGEEFEIMCYGPTWGKIGVIVADMFKQIGINAVAFQAESATYNSRGGVGDFDMVCYTYSFPVFGSGISNFLSNTGCRFSTGDSEYDVPAAVEGSTSHYEKIKQLCADALATTDEATRKELYAEIQELWMDDLITLPLLHNWAYDGIEAGLEGVFWVGNGEHDFRYLRIAED